MNANAEAGADGRIGPFDAPDRYRLTELRSRGGEGELWLGTVDVGGQDLPVAVKVITPEPESFDAVATRLRAQAELLRSLDHPNVVKVREAFEGPEIHPDGAADTSSRALYLVMNFVAGDDLVTWVERRPERDVLEVTRIVSRLAAALDYLHRGEATGGVAVLHRDVKPANAIVGPDGSVRLVDFGFARFVDVDSRTLVGTPDYVAPEVVAGDSPGEGADRFGLGAVTYYLFTGAAPDLADPAGMRAALLAVKGVEDREGFADHVLAMLAREPSRRPVDVVAWAHGLAVGAVSQSFQSVSSGRPRSRRRMLVVLAVVVLLLAGGGTALALLNSPADDPEAAGNEDPALAEDDEADPGAESEADPGAEVDPGEPAEVPDVEGQPLADARAELQDLGFRVEVEYEASAEPAGTVLRQEPAQGTADVEAVALVVAEEPVTMPEVLGERLAAALRVLEPLGDVETVDVINEDVPDGEVIEQVPEAGEPFSPSMTLMVARQPVITYLADREPVEGEADRESSQVSGETYTRAVTLTVPRYSDDPEQRAGYNLGRYYREFRATVGLRDDMPSAASVTVEVYGDGRELFSEEAGLGDAVPLELDVTGVLRLEFFVTGTRQVTVVWGDARVLGTPDEVPEDELIDEDEDD